MVHGALQPYPDEPGRGGAHYGQRFRIEVVGERVVGIDEVFVQLNAFDHGGVRQIWVDLVSPNDCVEMTLVQAGSVASALRRWAAHYDKSIERSCPPWCLCHAAAWRSQ
ncbi:hypothetical protein ACTD5D_30925 [Nocardia takedensis]|uniref:hypothetical protein n=1 Tax=Nocardia takedensis TaxID=259390 RepID=UPI003F75EB47